MPESVSQAQRSLFAAALDYKLGNTPDSQVTSNIRKIANETSIEDLRALAGTDPSELPYKVGTSGGGKEGTPSSKTEAGGPMDRHDFYLQHQEEHPEATDDDIAAAQSDYDADLTDRTYDTMRDKQYFGETGMDSAPMAAPMAEKEMNIQDVIGRFTEHNKRFMQQPMVELAKDLASIAELAEVQLVQEEGNDWYDKHTIGRNVKEMKAYAKEFEKLAEEADEFNTRMQALYQDMGRVLERYFDVYDPADKGGEMLTEPDTGVENECGGTCGECSTPMRESCTIAEDSMTAKALPLVRKKLSEAHRILFDRLPSDTKRKVIWRLL